jgi:hypothetical protein
MEEKLEGLLENAEAAKLAWEAYKESELYQKARAVVIEEHRLAKVYGDAVSSHNHRRDYLAQKQKNDQTKVNLEAKRVTLREFILMPGSVGNFKDLKLTSKAGKEMEVYTVVVKLDPNEIERYKADKGLKYMAGSMESSSYYTFQTINVVKDLIENYSGILCKPDWPRYKSSGYHKYGFTLDDIYVEIEK